MTQVTWRGYTPNELDEDTRWILLAEHDPNQAAQIILRNHAFRGCELPSWAFVVELARQLNNEAPQALHRWERYFWKIRYQLNTTQRRLLKKAEVFYAPETRAEARVIGGLARRGLVVLARDKKSAWCSPLGRLLVKRLPPVVVPKIEVLKFDDKVTVLKDGKKAVEGRWLKNIGLVDQNISQRLDDDDWKTVWTKAAEKCQ